MGAHIVEIGENIFDVSLKIYGGIEGLFDLLVSNQDAINQTGLSLCDTLQAGDKLEYTDDFTVNFDIANWLKKNNVQVRNGEHIYIRYDIEKYSKICVKQYNISIIKNAFSLWPAMKSYTSNTDEATVNSFLNYINTNRVWIAEVTTSNITALKNGNYSIASNITVPSRLKVPKMVIKQIGNLSTFTYNLKSNNIAIIDWGDNTAPEMCMVTNKLITIEHCYSDPGNHVINIYGNLGFSFLDLRGIGGTYYPLSEIQVSGEFYSDLQENTTINRLISVQ